MAWLLIIWIALICLWGLVGERWTVGSALNRLSRRLRVDAQADAGRPFDWAQPSPPLARR